MNFDNIQIGVMGSMADVGLKEELASVAKETGKEIASKGAVLLFGYEGDFDSLPTIAAKSAEENGGKTVAFIWGKSFEGIEQLKSTRIVTGSLRGGGREFPLVVSCDAIICIGGGSGTLTEICMAYQAGIPVIVVKGTGGWSEKLANTYLDERKRELILTADNPSDAVNLALKTAKEVEK